MADPGARARFEATLPFPPDAFQRRSFEALDAGHSVLVAAPTGSGKTVVAEYAIEQALAAGRKAFYTTPLKALSNQKYHDLVARHGARRVGLLTGDNTRNGEAPVVVMTTEVLRNMVYASSPTLQGLHVVVLDEVHYLQDPARGAVWEEVIIHLDHRVTLVCLSATVSNASEVAAWIEAVRGPTDAVVEERRPVTLEHRYAVAERGSGELHLLPVFVDDERGVARPNPAGAAWDAAGRRTGPRGPRPRGSTPWRVDVVERLRREELLPAIVFVFSRAGCDRAVEHCMQAGLRLTDARARREIERIAEDHLAGLAPSDLEALGADRWLEALRDGIAAHHAGMVPPMKEAVEAAFATGLVPVVFATETLALGINMPARTVVIEKLTKFTGERHEQLTAGEFTQLTGRAGRRGIDERGYAVVEWSPYVAFETVAALAARRSSALTSSFRPTYNMAANLVARHEPHEARHLLNLSFAQYRADRDVVVAEQQSERTRARLADARRRAGDGPGDLEEYLSRRAARDDAARAATSGGLQALRPGDVVHSHRHGPVVVLRPASGRSGRIQALTAEREIVRLAAPGLAGSGARIGEVVLPRPFSARNPAFRRAVATSLASFSARGAATAVADPAAERLAQAEAELASHPAHDDPRLEVRIRAAAEATRLARELGRLERRVSRRSDSLARQFDRVLEVLEAWGYVEGWELTEAGEVLRGLATETDLLVAESVREGLFDGLDAPEVAALASCFVYERRGPDGTEPGPPARWPTDRIRRRAGALADLSRDLTALEHDTRLPSTRAPDPGFADAVHAWARGDDLGAILDAHEVTGGDFVRILKQVIDLVRQIEGAAPRPETRARSAEAVRASLRGVVAASTLLAEGS